MDAIAKPSTLIPTEWFEAMTERLPGIMGSIPLVFLSPRAKALKIGIKEDLIACGADPEKIDAWLKAWTSHPSYIAAVAWKRHRHDIEGNDVGPIKIQHRNHAYSLLRKLYRTERAAA